VSPVPQTFGFAESLAEIRGFPCLCRFSTPGRCVALNLYQRYCGLIIAVDVEQARPDP
jgi:hypothetical protein